MCGFQPLGLGSIPSGRYFMEGKPAKVLGRPAKTDVRSYVLGASPMPSSIYGVHSLMAEPEVVVLLVSVQFWVHTPISRLRTMVSLLVSKTSDSGSNPLACAILTKS